MIRAAALALVLPTAVMAQPWHGIWSADLAWCGAADQIGSVTPAPIALSASEMRGYENTCAVTKVSAVCDMNAWALTLECQSEGETYDEPRLVMVDRDRLWMWFGGEAPVPFERCPA